MENVFLNYTHGSYLTNICNEIIKVKTAQNSTGSIKFIIEQEKCNIHKDKSSEWGYTNSAFVYFDYLNKISLMVDEDADEEGYKDLIAEISAITRRKIHALFLTQEPACWPSLETVVEAAQNDPDYNATVVYTPYFHENYTEQTDYTNTYIDEMNVPVTKYDEYDLTADSPDVVFMIKPYGNVPAAYEIKQLEKVIPRVVYIPYGMEITKDLIKFGFRFYAHYKAWRHCAYGDVVKEYGTEYGFKNGENIAVWGHPKADHYRDMEKNRENIPQEWKDFIGGRKTILWTPHHLIDLESDGTGTWLIWGTKILQLALENPDIAFIMRPHPLMFGALVNNGVLTEEELELMIDRIKNSGNILLDDGASYHNAFNAADAIITDGTTFSIEFLYTKKPIMLTPRNMEGFYLYEQMMESYYIATDTESVSNYINMIRNDEDPLCEKRIDLYNKTFYIPEDITVGENIINNVKKELADECCAPIDLSLYESCEISDIEIVDRLEADEFYNAAENNDSNNFEDLPLLSVLVLCYKNKNLLFGMLDTIFRQVYPHIQLIVSDDCSDDFSVDEITNYINKHKCQNIQSFIVRKNEENIGTVKHIAKAYEYVESDYFIFTAADDRFTYNTVFYDYIKAFLSNKDALWLVARANLVNSEYKNLNQTLPSSSDKEYLQSGDPIKLYSRWSRRGIAIPCSMAFRKTGIDLVGGFDLSYGYIEDWPLELKLLRSKHMPIFLDKITALHSKGGITNSNQAYGIEIRKRFFDDKKHVLETEVDPYAKLMTSEDKKAYKQYKREIMARHYFFFIDLPQAKTKGQKLKLILKKPIRAWWWFEMKYDKMKEKIHRKKLFAASHIMILLSLLFFAFNLTGWQDVVADVMAIFDLVIGFALLAVSIITFPLDRYFKYKAALRQKLTS
ncbi:MAG: glycosyltransferase [Ruminococcaceae bacterium]|nr:glycosyltransferase [Oscillospiraceae bacterium]